MVKETGSLNPHGFALYVEITGVGCQESRDRTGVTKGQLAVANHTIDRVDRARFVSFVTGQLPKLTE